MRSLALLALLVLLVTLPFGSVLALPPADAATGMPTPVHILPTPTPAAPPDLRYVAGSTVKLEQLIGDEDKELHQPTLSQTAQALRGGRHRPRLFLRARRSCLFPVR